jgi:hypothetical protein
MGTVQLQGPTTLAETSAASKAFFLKGLEPLGVVVVSAHEPED